jgi:hypothetical protein
MARDLSTYNRVSSVAPKQSNTALGDAISGLAEMSVNIIKQEQASNMTKLYSDMQLELNELDHAIKVDYESNPQLAQEKYKESFTKIVDRYGANVSPSLTRDWEASVNKVKTTSLLQMQNWGFKQGQINTTRNIASSLDNIYKMATSQGMDYGLADGDDLDVLLGTDASLSPLMYMSSKMLGEETTKQMFDGVSESYMKSFISGVAETNPMKALELLNDEQVVSKMNAGHRSEMQKAIENKVLDFEKIKKRNSTLSLYKNNQELYRASLERNLTYAELQQSFDNNPDMTDVEKDYFLKVNGYRGEEVKLTPEQELSYKGDLFNKINLFGKNVSDMKGDDQVKYFKELENSIFEGLNNKSISDKEANFYFDKLLEPKKNAIEQNIKQFVDKSNDPFRFDGIKKVFQEKFEIKEGQEGGFSLPNFTEPKKESVPEIDLLSDIFSGKQRQESLTNTQNMRNQIKFYEYYIQELDKYTEQEELSLNELSYVNTPAVDRIYNKALDGAVDYMYKELYPDLKAFKELPNAVLQKGSLNIMNYKPNSINPDVVIDNLFDKYEKDGEIYRVYKNGLIEKIKNGN